MPDLSNLQVAVLATDGFEESELTQPVHALRETGAIVSIVTLHPGQIQGFQHHDKSMTVEVDMVIDDAEPDLFDAVMLPGGALNADAMRMQPKVQSFLRAMQKSGKPIAAICHAPWELISADVVRGRKLTSYYTIQDDIRNAGGSWADKEVVVDHNWVTSRKPDDIPSFNREMISLLSEMYAARKRRLKTAS